MIGVNAFVIAALIGVSPALADAVTCSRWQGGLTAARSLGRVARRFMMLGALTDRTSSYPALPCIR